MRNFVLLSGGSIFGSGDVRYVLGGGIILDAKTFKVAVKYLVIGLLSYWVIGLLSYYVIGLMGY